ALAGGTQLYKVAEMTLKPRLFVLFLFALLLAYPLKYIFEQGMRRLGKPPRRRKVLFLGAAGFGGLYALVALGALRFNFLSLGKALIISANFASLVIIFPLFLFVLADLAWERWIGCLQAEAINQRLARVYPLIFTGIFLIILLLPLFGFSGDLQLFQKNFWGNAALRKVYSGLRQYVFRDIYYDKVILGKNNWMNLSVPDSMDDYQRTNQFGTEDLKAIQTNLDDIYIKLKEQGILFLVVLPPDKNTIYPEYLPPQIPVIGKLSRLDQLIAYQKEHGQAPIIDLRPALLAEKKKGPVFYSTDTHWNPYGALAATREMILPLQEKFPTLKVHDLTDYKKKEGVQVLGDMALNSVPSAHTEEWFSLESRYDHNWVRFNISDQMPVIVSMVHKDSTLPRAVIYHDSFMIWQYHFVADYFSKVTFIWSYNVDLNFVKGEKPDVVFLECTERYLDSLVSHESTWNKD
ncbi:MAG: hypothetical protein IH586_08760, partial [Anaerolineaceae bacterium]|nr:hypothetical protein [Anaerolineaceae bacterium]